MFQAKQANIFIHRVVYNSRSGLRTASCSFTSLGPSLELCWPGCCITTDQSSNLKKRNLTTKQGCFLCWVCLSLVTSCLLYHAIIRLTCPANRNFKSCISNKYEWGNPLFSRVGVSLDVLAQFHVNPCGWQGEEAGGSLQHLLGPGSQCHNNSCCVSALKPKRKTQPGKF